MTRARDRRVGAIATVTAVVAVDQIAKATAMHVRSPDIIIPARNPGMITGWSPLSVSALILASLFVLLVFVLVVGRWAVHLDISPMIPALVCGGFIAHVIDRVRFGAVRDFLATGWLIIDVGDLAIVIGLIALVGAFALRVYDLRRSSRTIGLQLPWLRAVIVDVESSTSR